MVSVDKVLQSLVLIRAALSVVETIRMRSHVQSTRYLVFRLVDIMLSKHRVGEIDLMGSLSTSSQC